MVEYFVYDGGDIALTGPGGFAARREDAAPWSTPEQVAPHVSAVCGAPPELSDLKARIKDFLELPTGTTSLKVILEHAEERLGIDISADDTPARKQFERARDVACLLGLLSYDEMLAIEMHEVPCESGDARGPPRPRQPKGPTPGTGPRFAVVGPERLEAHDDEFDLQVYAMVSSWTSFYRTMCDMANGRPCTHGSGEQRTSNGKLHVLCEVSGCTVSDPTRVFDEWDGSFTPHSFSVAIPRGFVPKLLNVEVTISGNSLRRPVKIYQKLRRPMDDSPSGSNRAMSGVVAAAAVGAVLTNFPHTRIAAFAAASPLAARFIQGATAFTVQFTTTAFNNSIGLTEISARENVSEAVHEATKAIVTPPGP